MSATDFPFSITSKFIGNGGAEHLVTVRGPTAEIFAQRLAEAACIFPYAGFVTSADEPQVEDPEREPERETEAPVNIAQARNQVMRQEQGAAAHGNAIAARNAQEQQARSNGAHPPRCPEHNRANRSQYYDGLYCPGLNADGSRCKWTWKPQEATGA
jgi:hypothetical protein